MMNAVQNNTSIPSTPEDNTVRTTIVGGRPPAQGRTHGSIPHGIEVLVKKAAVDPVFRGLLLTRRAEAAREIELTLTAAEVQMLTGFPEAQLRAIIANTRVTDPERRVFLGKAAAAMLALVVPRACQDDSQTLGIRPTDVQVEGIRPDMPTETPPPAPTGIRPDDVSQPDDKIEPPADPDPLPADPQGWEPGAIQYTTRGMRPIDPTLRPPASPASKGIRPDMPKHDAQS
ncbi:MAG: hypothetical protein JXA33_06810 [Anaerolineae bacterium]|nr:hypothetical protein [Anaerolineae bacterium]